MKRMKYERRRSRRWQSAAAWVRKVTGGNLWGMGTVTVWAYQAEHTFEEVIVRPRSVADAIGRVQR
jgi:hypothetical protein